MKKYLQFLMLILISSQIIGQTPGIIKKDKQYIWGEATAESLDLADQYALRSLVSQISTRIESSFSTVMTESGENLEEFTQSAINSYSNIYLNNAKRIVIQKRNKNYVIRYISRNDIDEIFKGRKQKILDYTNLAVISEKDYRIADALRYYYWALSLLSSHPESNKVQYRTDDLKQITLHTFIQSEIDKILHNLKFELAQTTNVGTNKRFIINVLYNNKPVSNLDYVYWTGTAWSNLYSLKDGLGVLEFFHEQSEGFSHLRIKLEYMYYGRSTIDSEVKSVLEMSSLPRLKNAEVSIPIDNPGLISAQVQKIEKYNNLDSLEIISEKINLTNSDYENLINKVNKSLFDKNTHDIKNIFTESGLACYERLLNYGNAQLLPMREELRTFRINNTTVVRSVPMLFNFPSNNRSFVEDLVYTFDENGKICNIDFALSNKAIEDITSKSDRFGSDHEKYFLISLLEKYKTAYSLENIDFIKNVFSDNALIIVGTIIKEAEALDNMYKVLEGQNVKYTRYSKTEYIEHLEKVFNSKEYVNIQFEENEVKRLNAEEKIYGIQLAQNYYSSNYSDKGYLFLMIDLNDTLNPRIYVRTWQQDKNPDGTIIGLEHFNIK